MDTADYDAIGQDDVLRIEGLKEKVAQKDVFRVSDITKGFDFDVRLDVSPRLRNVLLAGGLLNYTKKSAR